MSTDLNKVIKYLEEIAIPVTGSQGFDTNQLHGFLGELKTAFYLGKMDKTYKPAPPNTPDYDGVSKKFGKVSSKYATISSKDSRIFLNENLGFNNLFITKKENNEQKFYLIPREALTTDRKEKSKIYLTKEEQLQYEEYLLKRNEQTKVKKIKI